MKPKEHPILFSTPMVQAILDGRKTQTRRVIKNPNKYERIELCGFCCPYGFKGDHLWVREAWGDVTRAFQSHDCEQPQVWAYRADEAVHNSSGFLEHMNNSGIVCRKWRPSIFMPRWMSRITLEITDVRVERIQDISEEDAKAEGRQPVPFTRAGWPASDIHRDAFAEGWDKLNAKRGYSWDSNPWTWAISFQRVFPV